MQVNIKFEYSWFNYTFLYRCWHSLLTTKGWAEPGALSEGWAINYYLMINSSTEFPPCLIWFLNLNVIYLIPPTSILVQNTDSQICISCWCFIIHCRSEECVNAVGFLFLKKKDWCVLAQPYLVLATYSSAVQTSWFVGGSRLHLSLANTQDALMMSLAHFLVCWDVSNGGAVDNWNVSFRSTADSCWLTAVWSLK